MAFDEAYLRDHPQLAKKVPIVGLLREGSLSSELRQIQELVAVCEDDIHRGKSRRLPANAAFLADGRALCRERQRGVSRYPYGADGFNFWVNASGYMHANRGLFFLFQPPREGREAPIAFFSGCRIGEDDHYTPHALLPVPLIDQVESRTLDRFTVIGHDAAYFVSETPEVFSAVRVFLDQSRSQETQLHFSVYVENKAPRPMESYTSAYMEPFCRHSFVESNEDRWYKRVFVDLQQEFFPNQRTIASTGEIILPPFVIQTHEEFNRLQSVRNDAHVSRTIGMTNKITGKPFDLSIGRGEAEEKGDVSAHSIGMLRTQECTSRLGYTGSPRRNLGSAKFLATGQFDRDIPLTVFNDNGVVGDLLRFVLPTDSYVQINYSLTIPESGSEFHPEKAICITLEDTDRALERVRQKSQARGNLTMRVQGPRQTNLTDETLNHFLVFLKKQVSVCAMLKGYMNPSANSLIGFRDVFQALEGHLFDQPNEVRRKILEALNYVLDDGRCPRQYSLSTNGVPGRADLREYIDQGVWAISSLSTYLAVTGDGSLLEESVGYHRVSSRDQKTIRPTAGKDTVLEHLIRIMDYLSQHRDPETGLVLALYGDWNDAVDGLGLSADPQSLFGTGVSVMTSLQLYRNCSEMIEILAHYAPDHASELTGRYRRLREELRAGLMKYAVVSRDDQRRIVHGWGDRRSYYVGSFCDSDGLARDGLTSNAFWILSDILREDLTLRESILAALERLDSPYGLKTFEPGFAPDTRGVGRIVKVPMGAAENGGTYVHATTFAIAALFRVGEPKKAWEQIAKILPYAAHLKDPSHSPFVMANAYVDNPHLNLTGQSMDDWQTGSSNALLKLLIRDVFGFEPTLDALRIAPARWFPFDEFEFLGVAQGRQVRISYQRKEVLQREVALNGERLETAVPDDLSGIRSALIPYASLSTDKENQVEIYDPAPV